MKEFKFNMNNSVKVKLNDKGRAELRRLHSELEDSAGCKLEFKERGVDKNGYSSFQLHDLMYTFGHMMVMGCETPFETLNVKIPEVLLKSVN